MIIDSVFEILKRDKSSTATKIWNELWEKEKEKRKNKIYFNRTIQKSLKSLFGRGKITRLNFRTEKGYIYGLTTKDCWDYCFKNRVVPERLIKQFFWLLKERMCVTNLELKEIGFPYWLIRRWIEKKLVKEGKYIKIHRVNNDLRIYYPPELESKLPFYLKSDQFQEIYEEYCLSKRKIQGVGPILEEIVEELMKKMGYEYRKQFPVFERFYVGELKHKVFAVLDGFAFKKLEHFGIHKVIIECKNWKSPLRLNKITRLDTVREFCFKNGADIWFFALSGGYRSVWNYVRHRPYIQILSEKDLRELCGKYRVKSYLKIAKEYGTLRKYVRYH